MSEHHLRPRPVVLAEGRTIQRKDVSILKGGGVVHVADRDRVRQVLEYLPGLHDTAEPPMTLTRTKYRLQEPMEYTGESYTRFCHEVGEYLRGQRGMSDYMSGGYNIDPNEEQYYCCIVLNGPIPLAVERSREFGHLLHFPRIERTLVFLVNCELHPRWDSFITYEIEFPE